LRVEEKSEVVKYIVKEIVHYYTSFDASGQGINELVVFLNLAESVVGPEIFEMLVYLSVQTIRKWFVLSEAS